MYVQIGPLGYAIFKCVYPSVVAAFSTTTTYQSSILKILVTAGSLGLLPQYLLSFKEVLVFSCFDEACSPERDWPEVEFDGVKPCSWQWVDSPWVNSYQGCGNFNEAGEPDPLFHYLIAGGDNIVEVIARAEPTIEELMQPIKISFDFEF